MSHTIETGPLRSEVRRVNAAAEIAAYLPRVQAARVCELADRLTEIRLRAKRPMQLVFDAGDEFVGEPISPLELKRLALKMMEHSFHAREDELKRGFFTLSNGCRVGVCGSFSILDGEICALQSIGSLCIRVAREVVGCAGVLVDAILSGGQVASTLILSRPGLGKTTLLRDAVRTLSDRGYCVGLADERHELAACREGVPMLDVGQRTDVIDGCPKHLAMERIIRSMAPSIIATDEIGDERDAQCVLEASHKGIAVLATAHAGSFADLQYGIYKTLIDKGAFAQAVLLGNTPGRIIAMHNYRETGERHGK